MNSFSAIRDIASLTGYEFETACREHTKYAYLGNNTGLCKILTKYNIYIDTRDIGVAPHFIMDGFWETWLTQCLVDVVKEGDVCIDMGANLGYYSLLMSELCGKTGRTVAIEPNPHIANLLRHSQSTHAFNFDVVEAAISNKSGKTILSIPGEYPGSASISQRFHPSWRASRIKVRMMTADELVTSLSLPKVDVIKIDTEGAEPMVFEGMQKTIADNPDLKIVIEYSPHIYPDARTFTQYLFSQFIVHRIKDVEKMTLLDESSVDSLLQLNDHTDLFLTRK